MRESVVTLFWFFSLSLCSIFSPGYRIFANEVSSSKVSFLNMPDYWLDFKSSPSVLYNALGEPCFVSISDTVLLRVLADEMGFLGAKEVYSLAKRKQLSSVVFKKAYSDSAGLDSLVKNLNSKTQKCFDRDVVEKGKGRVYRILSGSTSKEEPDTYGKFSYDHDREELLFDDRHIELSRRYRVFLLFLLEALSYDGESVFSSEQLKKQLPGPYKTIEKDLLVFGNAFLKQVGIAFTVHKYPGGNFQFVFPTVNEEVLQKRISIDKDIFYYPFREVILNKGEEVKLTARLNVILKVLLNPVGRFFYNASQIQPLLGFLKSGSRNTRHSISQYIRKQIVDSLPAKKAGFEDLKGALLKRVSYIEGMTKKEELISITEARLNNGRRKMSLTEEQYEVKKHRVFAKVQLQELLEMDFCFFGLVPTKNRGLVKSISLHGAPILEYDREDGLFNAFKLLLHFNGVALSMDDYPFLVNFKLELHSLLSGRQLTREQRKTLRAVIYFHGDWGVELRLPTKHSS